MTEIEILKDLVKFNTIKDKDNKKIINYIEKYLKDLKFKTVYKNKILIMKNKEECAITFIGHSDTVEITNGWKTDPLTLTKKDNKLYGLGTCDMKGGIACFLKAIQDFDLDALNKGIQIIITYDEEIGFNGILDVLKYNKKYNILKSNLYIIGEPTNNKYLTGCKGLYAIELFTKGIKVHSSTPNKGKSAISLMIKVINELQLSYENKIKLNKYDCYEVPFTTMNIGLLNGGSAKNSVAQDCYSYIDFRVADSMHIKMLQNKLDKLCKKYPDFSYKEEENIKPFYNEIDYIKESGTAGFMTEASFVEGTRIILGPGPVTAHEINEYVTIERLDKAVKQYKELIKINCCK